MSRACPLCHGAAVRAFENPEARPAHSDTPFQMLADVCTRCAFVFYPDAGTPEYARVMLEDQTYYRDMPFAFPRRGNNATALAFILEAMGDRPGLDILEIGSGRGDLLFMVKEARPGCNILGIDPSQGEARVPTLRTRFDPAQFSSRFDLVVMKHVLEHMADPQALVRVAVQVLRPGGQLYVEVPSLESILQDQVEGFMAHHVGYFTRSTLALALAGCDVLKAEVGASVHMLCRPGGAGNGAPAGAQKPGDAPEAIRLAIQELAAARSRGMAIIQEHLKAGGRIVYYGIYTLFRLFHREIRARFPDQGQHVFHEDGSGLEREPLFGLPRAGEFRTDDLILLCSNNAQVLDRMADRCAGRPGAVLRPWASFDGQPLGRRQHA